MSFDLCCSTVSQLEGGYVNDPSDSGGETNHGVTVAVARAFGYIGPMKDMPLATAQFIFKRRYWDVLQLDEVCRMSFAIANELFDTAINMGTDRAGKFLQRSLNVLNNEGAMYSDTVVDGRVGAMTVAALREYLKRRGSPGESVMVRMLNCLQGAFYVELAEQRAKDEKYVYGWFLNRVIV